MIDTYINRLLARSAAEKRLYPPPKIDFRIRPYTSADREEILRIFGAIDPGGFPQNARSEFESYIDTLPSSFFVAESEIHGLLACGGISGLQDNMHTLCYGLVAPEHQGKRVGTTLTLARIVAASKSLQPHFSLIYTVQNSIHFYEKFGYYNVGVWHSETDGTEYPIGIFAYHSSALEKIRKTLHERGHLIDGSIRIQHDERINPTIEEIGDGFLSIKLESNT